MGDEFVKTYGINGKITEKQLVDEATEQVNTPEVQQALYEDIDRIFSFQETVFPYNILTALPGVKDAIPKAKEAARVEARKLYINTLPKRNLQIFDLDQSVALEGKEFAVKGIVSDGIFPFLKKRQKETAQSSPELSQQIASFLTTNEENLAVTPKSDRNAPRQQDGVVTFDEFQTMTHLLNQNFAVDVLKPIAEQVADEYQLR